MKNITLFLDNEDDEDLTIGLIRQIPPLPEHEFFFQLNLLNHFSVQRKEDMKIHGDFYIFHHSRYEVFHPDFKICLEFISNKSIQFSQKKAIGELFINENDVNFLLNNMPDVNYIIKSTHAFSDFSLFLQTGNLIFQIQNFEVKAQEELYKLLKYYE